MAKYDGLLNQHLLKVEETYSPKYYSCAKFLRDVAGFKFKKIQKYVYFVEPLYTTTYDVFLADGRNNCVCCKENTLQRDYYYRGASGRRIGTCPNKCCRFYKKNTTFIIRWFLKKISLKQ